MISSEPVIVRKSLLILLLIKMVPAIVGIELEKNTEPILIMRPAKVN